MTEGIFCATDYGKSSKLPARLLSLAAGVLFFAALWGGVLNAAGISGLPGLLFSRNGMAVLLNRLMEASQRSQAYVYEMLPEGEMAPLLPMFLLTAAMCVLRGGRGALFLLFTVGGAYLGVSPGTPWLVALGAGMLLSLIRPPRSGWKGGGLAILAAGLGAAALCAGSLLLLPGENAALSAWEESARDALAANTAIYLEEQAPPELPPEAPEQAEAPEEPDPTLALPNLSFLGRRPVWIAALVILLFALLLFIPSIYSDRLKKRRAQNRAGLEDADPAAAIRAALPYAMRWLVLGGLTAENVPMSGYAGQIGERFSPEVLAEFQAVLPLWQEAAYSDHPMSEEQRARVRAFAELARTAARERMGKKEKLLAEYVYAL